LTPAALRSTISVVGTFMNINVIPLSTHLTQWAGPAAWVCGGLVALVKTLDFLLSDQLKAKFKKMLETAWLRLAAWDERVTNEIKARVPEDDLQPQKGYIWLIRGIHAIIALNVLIDDTGHGEGTTFVIGFPSIFAPAFLDKSSSYTWLQAFIDLSALAISAFVICPRVLPALSRWVFSQRSLWSFTLRSVALAILICVLFGALRLIEKSVIIPYLPVIGSLSRDVFIPSGIYDNPAIDELRHKFAQLDMNAGSFAALIIIDAMTAAVAAPLVVSMVIIAGVILGLAPLLIFGASQRALILLARFLLFRIATYPKGALAAIVLILLAIGTVFTYLPDWLGLLR
jgi:hypothetical protein